jgi:hypothetical protein
MVGACFFFPLPIAVRLTGQLLLIPPLPLQQAVGRDRLRSGGVEQLGVNSNNG